MIANRVDLLNVSFVLEISTVLLYRVTQSLCIELLCLYVGLMGYTQEEMKSGKRWVSSGIHGKYAG
jgi:hypothetical protein